MIRPLMIAILLASSAESAQAAPASSLPAVAIPGGSSGVGFDDLTFSPELKKVIVPAGGTGEIDLIDPATHAVTEIPGVAPVSPPGKGHEVGTTSADGNDQWIVASNRSTKQIELIDPKSRKVFSSAPVSGDPDYVRRVDPANEIWVTEPGEKQIEIFTRSDTGLLRIGAIPVPGGPESLVIDVARKRAYTNLWAEKTLAIDLATRRIVSQWPNGCEKSRGLALDETARFLFVGCGEGKAVTLDLSRNGAQVAQADTGAGVDIISYNSRLRHLYAPSGKSKTMTVLAVDGAGKLSKLATVPTAAGAHCVIADDQDNAWICAPEKGQLLLYHDGLPAGSR